MSAKRASEHRLATRHVVVGLGEALLIHVTAPPCVGEATVWQQATDHKRCHAHIAGL